MNDLEILVLGDGGFVFAVLNAVSGVSSGGYGTLGALGALIGLILMMMKGMMAQGGPKFSPHTVLVSFVIFWVMFIPRMDKVIITEVSVQPGNLAPRSFVVDNVPFGLAGAGYLVSNIGVKITGLMETINGSATDEARGSTGGLGRNLMLMAALRDLLANPAFTDPPVHVKGQGYLATYRENMTQFTTECVIPLANNHTVSMRSVFHSPGTSGLLSDTVANRANFMLWADTSGERSTIDCRTARDRLVAAEDQRLATAFDMAMDASGKAGSSAEIVNAFGRYANENGMQMQKLVATSMVTAIAAEAAVRGSLSPTETQAILMVEEGAQRRNFQWAGEENLFIRILRPTIGFFEALFYALAPIMAFVCTLGPFGWTLLSKYMLLTVWVGLWFPMLSITQLYSNIQMSYFFERMTSGEHYSPYQMQQIANQAMDTLGTASALTAATPALAMSLIYGGAVSMSYLAGRLQGSDMIDENKAAPMASSVGAVASQSAFVSGTSGGGSVTTGGSDIKISTGTGLQENIRSSESAMRQQTAQAGKVFSEMVNNGWSIDHSGGQFGRTSEMVSAGNDLKNAVRESEGQSSDKSKTMEALESLNDTQLATLMTAHRYSEQHGVDLGASLRKFGFDAGANTSWSWVNEETKADSSASSRQDALSEKEAISRGLSAAVSHDETLGSSMMNGISAEIGAQYSRNGGTSEQFSQATNLSNSATEAVSAANAYEASVAASRQVGFSSETTGAQFITNMRDNGTLGTSGAEMYHMVQGLGDSARSVYAGNLSAVANSNIGKTASAEEQAALASFMTLVGGGSHIPSDMADDAALLSSRVMAENTSSVVQGSEMFNAGRASSNAGVGAGAPEAGSVFGATAHVDGSSASADAVQAGANAAIGGGHGAVQDRFGSLGASQATAGLSSGGYQDLESNYQAASDRFNGIASDMARGSIPAENWSQYREAAQAAAADFADATAALPQSRLEGQKDILGFDADASAHDVLGTYQSQTDAINRLERAGFTDEADIVRASQAELSDRLITAGDTHIGSIGDAAMGEQVRMQTAYEFRSAAVDAGDSAAAAHFDRLAVANGGMSLEQVAEESRKNPAFELPGVPK